jgi:hypothetical protein
MRAAVTSNARKRAFGCVRREIRCRTFAIGLPVVDGGFAVFDGDEIILREQTIFSQRREGCFRI